MSKKIAEDTWVICPVCKTKLKQTRLPAHMKRVHKKKMDDEEMKNVEMSRKKRVENNTSRFLSKKSIGVLAIVVVVVVAAIGVYFLFYAQNDQKSHVVSVQYAHARACSILKKAGDWERRFDATLLTTDYEKALVKTIASFPSLVSDCADYRKTHSLAVYAQDVAAEFNQSTGLSQSSGPTVL